MVCVSHAVARTAKASTGSSILRTCETKRLEGKIMRPPTTPPSADAQGSKVAQPEVITIMPVSAQLPAAYRSLQRSHQRSLSSQRKVVKPEVITTIPVSAQLPAAFRSLHGMRTIQLRGQPREAGNRTPSSQHCRDKTLQPVRVRAQQQQSDVCWPSPQAQDFNVHDQTCWATCRT